MAAPLTSNRTGGSPASGFPVGGCSVERERLIKTETQKGHNYLRCTKRVSDCTQKYVREEVVATQVDQTIARVVLEATIADKIVRQSTGGGGWPSEGGGCALREANRHFAGPASERAGQRAGISFQQRCVGE